MKHNKIYRTFAIGMVWMMAFPTVAQESNVANEPEQQDSLVNVAFGKTAQKDLLGAVSNVNVRKLLEKDYHQGSLDDIDAMVGGYNGNIWAQGALVLVDGFPRSASSVRASEVENVTILKGASAVALYGSRAAKGAVLITTRRGKVGRMNIDVRANTGWNVAKRYPNYLNSADYMTLYNEACRNDGIAEQYSQKQIYNSYTGLNPYRYPNMDFYSNDFIKKTYNKTDLTGEIYGGSDRVQYYTNFAISHNGSLMKYADAKNNDNLKFNVRANLDVKLNSWLSARVDAVALFSNSYSARGTQDNTYWSAASSVRPNWFTPLIPIDMMDQNNSSMMEMAENSSHLIDGKYLLGGTSTDQTNVFADMFAAGYIKDRSRTFLSDITLKADLGSILKGLTFSTAFALDYTANYSEAFKEGYAVYEPVWSRMNGQDLIIGLKKYNDDTNSTNETVGSSNYSQTMTFKAQFDYDRTFGKHHNLAAKLIGWGFQTQNSKDQSHDGSDYHRTTNVNLALQAAYNYKHRYYADLSMALVHSTKLPEDNRNALSPALSLGWRISSEKWFNASWMDDLKLTASVANLHQDLDISDYYMYQGYYDDRGGWYQWHDSSAGGWTNSAKRGDNPDLTFITRKEFRVGVETSLLNKMITLDANYFVNTTNGGLVQGSNTIYPSYYKYSNVNYYPYINFNEDKRQGVDFTLNLRKKFGEVDAQLGFVGQWYWSEAKKRDEVYKDAYQYRVGRALDSSWGLICDGFFQNEEDIANHATQTFGNVKPGDLKYRDVNGDGKVDSKDQVYLGHSGNGASPFTYGTNLTLKWKGFTLFVAGTGRSGAIGYKNSTYYWVYGSRKYSDQVWGRWIEETAATATYPRLTTTGNTNNFRNSTFWMYKQNRFDLSKVQITYDLPASLFQNKIVRGMSVYVSGDDLLTISSERKHMETNVGSAPQCRFYNLGVKVNL